MKKVILLTLLLLVLGGTSSRHGVAQAPDGLKSLMLKKLKNAQLVLEGLALKDFPRISSAAEELIQISRTEEWAVFKTPRYELHSNEFRRAAEAIIQKAQDKNLDGAALAYFDLTRTCLRCHQYVREVRDARLPGTLIPAWPAPLTVVGREGNPGGKPESKRDR